MLNNGRIEDRSRQEIIEEVTGEFWNKHQQSSFLSSKKPIILLVEGKHDKEHINNAYNALNEDFKNLDFEIFKLNTETNIQPFLRGLYEGEFDTSKIYIGLFDREAKILSDLKNHKNYSKIEHKSFCKIIESDKVNNNYFAAALPEIDDKKCDCSIEMMYDYEKWENAFKKAVENTIGKTSNKSIKDYSEDVLKDAKNILSENSKEFGKEDFKHFKKLFELITEIKEYSNGLSSPKTKQKTVTPVSTRVAPQTEATTAIIEIYTKRRSTDIIGHFDPITEKVTIQVGSIISADVVPSYKANEKTERNKLKKKHCEFIDDKWTVKTPIEFASPSGAIKFGVGSNINGWKYWLLKETKAELETIRKK
jgi:hypothetical protein